MSDTSPGLLQSVIDAHGGREYWETIQSLNVEFEFSGLALEMKGQPGPHDVRLVVHTKVQRVTILQFGDYYGSWTPTQTEVGKTGSKDPVDVRKNPKDVFDDYTAETKWDVHNLFYFVGYAYWNYFNFSFYLETPEMQSREVQGPTRENGEKWASLEVVFPDGYPTHTKVQKYDFDAEHRLMRMHYSVDVMKRNVPSWHNCYNHAVAGKYLYPTLRVVSSSVPGMTFFSPFTLRGIKVEVNHV